uniref:Protein MGARP N-terminal domain-containing protein n=1 Tax=Scophthalmus maximus TaxID=52904 RepID=A0A8D3AWC2_SCOMX
HCPIAVRVQHLAKPACTPSFRACAVGNIPLQRRSMSSLPGGSGENIVYALLCGGAFVTYSTVSSDAARYNDRLTEINARPKTEWVPKPWPPKSKYPSAVTFLFFNPLY